MARLLFEKKGNAIWISHLDLMRLFQRAFKRVTGTTPGKFRAQELDSADEKEMG